MEVTGYHYQTMLANLICLSGILSAAGGASVGLPGGRRQLCDGYRTYLDHGTGLCELCSEICRNAEIKGTEQQCAENCPHFLQAMRCEEKEGWFYDQHYGDCRSCCDCDHTPALKIVCMQKCAGVQVPDPPPSSDHAPAHLHTAAAVADGVPISPSPCALNNPPSHPRPSPSDTNVPVWIIIVVIVVPVVLGLVIIVAVYGVVILSPTVKPYRPVKQQQRDGGGPEGGTRTERARGDGGRPVEESRPTQPQSAAVVAADGTIRSMTIPVKTAFADLSVGHDGSRCEHV